MRTIWYDGSRIQSYGDFAMTKEAYKRTEIEIIAFTVDDVLTTSGVEQLDEYEVDPIK